MRKRSNKAEICLLQKENGVFIPVFNGFFKASKRRDVGRNDAYRLWEIARAIGRNRFLDGYEILITVTSFRGCELISNRVINSITGHNHLNACYAGEEV